MWIQGSGVFPCQGFDGQERVGQRIKVRKGRKVFLNFNIQNICVACTERSCSCMFVCMFASVPSV